MIERIEGAPAGVTGLRATGELSKDDYTEVLEPALAAAETGGEIRLLFILECFDGLAPGAWKEDVKTGLRAWAREHRSWRRMALVTDVEWFARSTRAFAWLAPGEVKVFPLAERDEARTWVAG
jgi:hypothetical protein